MKKLLSFLVTGLVLLNSNVMAEVETQDIGPQHPPAASNTEKGGPFNIHVFGDGISKAKTHKCGRLGDLTFATEQVELGFIYYYNECLEEGLNITLAYQNTYLDWRHNPFFCEKDFSTISLVFGGFSNRLCNWLWQGQVAVNFDNVPHWNYDDYMNYDLLLWGRYDWNDCMHLHIGFLAQTGMKIDRVYPIVGFDWTYSPKWKFNLIFPMDVSAIYQVAPGWSVALAGRFFDQRHRVSKHQKLSEALWSYRAAGGEIALNYVDGKWFKANIHVGYNFGGRLKIANRGYHHRRRYNVDGSGYAGADLSLKF